LVSNPLRLRIEPPLDEKRYETEYLAQDLFTEEVGRTLWFGGSQFLEKGNDTLREVAERLSDQRVALHANAALGNSVAREYKQLNLGNGKQKAMPVAMTDGGIVVRSPDVEEARKEFTAALLDKPDVAAASLGHINYHRYMDRFSNLLAEEGENQEAAKIQENLHDTLANRNVPDRVLKEIEVQREVYTET
jgi:hypothetical protein